MSTLGSYRYTRDSYSRAPLTKTFPALRSTQSSYDVNYSRSLSNYGSLSSRGSGSSLSSSSSSNSTSGYSSYSYKSDYGRQSTLSGSALTSARDTSNVTLTKYSPRKSSIDSCEADMVSNDDSPLKYCPPSAYSNSSRTYRSYSPVSTSSRTLSSRYSVKNSSADVPSRGSSPRRSTSKSLAGLTNLGNTCYMNSVLQALYATETIRELILSNQKTQLMNSLGRLFSSMKSNSSSVADPSSFRTQFVKLQNKFRNYEQHDAQEFLRYIVNSLHDEMNCAKPRTGLKPYDAPKTSQEAWTQYRSIDDSPLIDVLGGQLSSVIKCSSCSSESVCWDPFLDLSLPLPRNCSSADIESCLEEFQALEELDCNERIKCEKCNQIPSRSTKKLSIERPPSLLILHLKRFTNDGYKLSTPRLTVNQRLFIKSKSYSLMAAVNHHGKSSRAGHYTATCLHNNVWYEFNDDTVTVKKNFNPKQDLDDCYILFYAESSCSSRL
ncbi:Ubiquitin carboxyl-terminal hydrolase 2 [Halotydeus destructor]|nr:Ubiquitin carboxyl-terminal hydrolase 2 [Halotydeus destructor]